MDAIFAIISGLGTLTEVIFAILSRLGALTEALFAIISGLGTLTYGSYTRDLAAIIKVTLTPRGFQSN